MLREFKNYIEEEKLAGSGNRILAAVSGGIDSMVLADLLTRAGFDFGIAHCNFSLRASESDADEALVRSYAAKDKKAFFSIRFDTPGYAREKGISVEMAARELRYEWFEKIRSENGFDLIAVAHNLNDNIETMLLNLIRGTGIAGLTGIRPEAGRIIRPLLFATRKSIEEYALKHRVSFREDQTNSDTLITRNKIRHEVIPLLMQINPSVEFTLNETTERLLEVKRTFMSYTDMLSKELFSVNGNVIKASLPELAFHLGNSSVLYELFRPYGVTGSMIPTLVRVIRGKTGSRLFTSSHLILKDRKEILISENNSEQKEFEVIENFQELTRSVFFSAVEIREIDNDFSIRPDTNIAYLDNEKVIFPLIIRKWRKGDAFHPLGMEKSKKLSDYFIDRRYSRIKKEEILLLESAGKIVWIIGDRIDNRFRITSDSSRALIITK
ncbi:MAG: tRNA lysidine(34) synthetase TilS [Bacteroidales bacterium]|nr:tRNA lysidine(34) synthetase TilS [Bacteroidales bacterium]MBN2632581.1 tRNA lysidine(34) synthetase TilS [Bacteroidales bacterium]